MTQEEFYKKLHRRIAQMAVGASAIRNQGRKGDKGLIKSCRNYFEERISLEDFFLSLSSDDKFKIFLDAHTENLVQLFPETAKSWGAARKGLNLFFRELVYNKYIADKYELSTDFVSNFYKIKNLEVPLDKDVASGLRKHFKRQLPKWKGIKHLTPELSDEYQNKSQKLAEEESIARVHLDVKFWREGR